MNFGIELEFFLSKKGKIVPAFEHITNTDGDSFIGEIRTDIHSTLFACVSELKGKIYLMQRKLEKKGVKMIFKPFHSLTKQEARCLKKNAMYYNCTEKHFTETMNVYGKKGLPDISFGTFRASLQINISENFIFTDAYITKNSNGIYVQSQKYHNYSETFDFPSLIHRFDKKFKKDIKNTNRVPGLYSIKDGRKGKRVEYKSLPNNIDLDKLEKLLFKE